MIPFTDNVNIDCSWMSVTNFHLLVLMLQMVDRACGTDLQIACFLADLGFYDSRDGYDSTTVRVVGNLSFFLILF